MLERNRNADFGKQTEAEKRIVDTALTEVSQLRQKLNSYLKENPISTNNHVSVTEEEAEERKAGALKIYKEIDAVLATIPGAHAPQSTVTDEQLSYSLDDVSNTMKKNRTEKNQRDRVYDETPLSDAPTPEPTNDDEKLFQLRTTLSSTEATIKGLQEKLSEMTEKARETKAEVVKLAQKLLAEHSD